MVHYINLVTVACSTGNRDAITIPDHSFVRIVTGNASKSGAIMFRGCKLIPLLMVFDETSAGVNGIGITTVVTGSA